MTFAIPPVKEPSFRTAWFEARRLGVATRLTTWRVKRVNVSLIQGNCVAMTPLVIYPSDLVGFD